MKKYVMLISSAMLAMSLAQSSLAEGKSEQAAKPVSCKQEAKASGLTDKKEIKEYVKNCKKARSEKAMNKKGS